MLSHEHKASKPNCAVLNGCSLAGGNVYWVLIGDRPGDRTGRDCLTITALRSHLKPRTKVPGLRILSV
jgi:hypothetical protein